MRGKFEFSAQGSDLSHFVGNGLKIKIHSEIKPPLRDPQTLGPKGNGSQECLFFSDPAEIS